MTISVAMATYNGERYLQTQLDSLSSQTRLPDELVICDDDSLDSTIEIAERFAKSSPFNVKVFRNTNRLGSVKNFELALTQCTGEIIALSDQDDIWLPEKLAKQGGLMEKNSGIGGVFSNAFLMSAQSVRTGQTLWNVNNFSPADQDELRSGGRCPAAVTGKKALGCTLMFRANLMKKIVPIPPIWEHDGWIAWMISVYSRLYAIPEPLIQYRIHASQQFGVARRTLLSRLHTKPAQYLNYANQLAEILERTSTYAPPDKEIDACLHRMMSYSRMRGTLPKNRFRRLSTVISNWNQYPQTINGALSALKDIAGLSTNDD